MNSHVTLIPCFSDLISEGRMSSLIYDFHDVVSSAVFGVAVRWR